MITLTEVRDELKLDPKQDKQLQRYRRAVIADFEQVTNKIWVDPDPAGANPGQFYKLRTNIDELSTEAIFIAGTNVRITEVKHWSASEAEDDADVLAATDYTFEMRGVHRHKYGKLWLASGGSVSSWKSNVKITYDAGFDPDETDSAAVRYIPLALHDIKDAMLLQIQFRFLRNSGDKMIQETQGFRGGSTRYRNDKREWHPAYASAIKKYKLKLAC